MQTEAYKKAEEEYDNWTKKFVLISAREEGQVHSIKSPAEQFSKVTKQKAQSNTPNFIESNTRTFSDLRDLDQYTADTEINRDKFGGLIIEDMKQDIPEKLLEIHGKCGTVSNWFADDFRRCPVDIDNLRDDVVFSGNYVEVDFNGLKHDTLLVYEVDFKVEKDDEYLVMVSTTANMRTWVDGVYAFGQECGKFVPALHRTPLNQRETLKLAKGKHKLTFALAPVTEDMDTAPVFFAVGNKKDRMHVHNAFARKILENN